MSRLGVSAAALATFATMAVAVPRASATVMEEVPLEEMVRDADAIVHGVVEDTGGQVVLRGDDAKPHTLTRLRVERWLKGDTGARQITIRELGGQWKGGGLQITGTPQYERGEEVIVFLERHPRHPEHYRTYAMVQGKFVVQHGAPGVPSVVRRDVDAVSFAKWTEGRMTVQRGRNGPAMQLGQFVQLIRRVRNEPSAGPRSTDSLGGAR